MIKISVAGDVCPKDRLKHTIANKEFDKVFGSVKAIFEGSDVSIANFECALSDGQDKPIVKCGPNLSCDESLVDALKWAGFNVLTLANNHFADFGSTSIRKSLDAIASREMRYVGAGMDLQSAQAPLVMDVRGKKLAIINCCEHEFSIASEAKAGCNPLNPVDQSFEIKRLRGDADYIMVIVHGGTEFCQVPSPRMKKLFRFFVDEGADVVINHHQHCYSGFETYNGKTIVYGTGNFCFDWKGKKQSSWNDGYIAQIVFDDEGNQQLNVIPYRQCDEKVGVFPLASGEELEMFQNEVNRLNAIISDDKQLSEEYTKWIDSHEVNSRMALSIYSSRIFRALCNRGLLPPFITKNRMVLLYDHINCESLRERVLRFIDKRVRE